jgi:transposase
MKIELSPEEKKVLEVEHKATRDRRVADRIKAVLLCAEGWSQVQIAQALRIWPETVHDHLSEYKASKRFDFKHGGTKGLLDAEQTRELIEHLEANTYVKVSEIGAYIQRTYGISYTDSGLTKWLHHHGFSYKKPKEVPAKADPIHQAAFIETYKTLLNTTLEDEPILFADGVHPTMATKVAYGWIKRGTDKPIATTASRTRMNLMGAINLQTMAVTVESFETLDSEAMVQYWEQVKAAYPKAPKIHIILDRGPYNMSIKTREAAEKLGIKLHFLPPYSPNLNPIERLWKVMNERVRNNRFFHSVSEFRDSILHFFHVTWPEIAHTMIDRINDNFQTLKQTSSS